MASGGDTGEHRYWPGDQITAADGTAIGWPDLSIRKMAGEHSFYHLFGRHVLLKATLVLWAPGNQRSAHNAAESAEALPSK